MCVHILEHYDYGYIIMHQLCYGKGPGRPVSVCGSIYKIYLCLDILAHITAEKNYSVDKKFPKTPRSQIPDIFSVPRFQIFWASIPRFQIVRPTPVQTGVGIDNLFLINQIFQLRWRYFYPGSNIPTRSLNISTPVKIFQPRCKYLNRGVNIWTGWELKKIIKSYVGHRTNK